MSSCEQALTEFASNRPPTSSPHPIPHPSGSIPLTAHTLDMKHLSSAKHARKLVYPKKRPSPNGIYRSYKTPSVRTSPRRRSSAAAKRAEWFEQRERQKQLAALVRDGILIEEEYREEVESHMHDMEVSTIGSMVSMDQQPEIKWHMRPCLLDFIVEVHFTFLLRPETLYLTMNIIDRYVSKRIVFIKHYQLVGCTALWMAAKYEDAKDRIPMMHDLVRVCRDTYEESAFLQMERHILDTIQWRMGHPTSEAWLRLICTGASLVQTKVQNVARFLMEITLYHREFIQYPSSSIALGALCLARFLCGKERCYAEETEECLEIVDHLDARLIKHLQDISRVLMNKYSRHCYSRAATFVVGRYLEGGRFTSEALVALPVTPIRTPPSEFSTPMSASTSASDMSDDMPATPTSPMIPSEAYGYMEDIDKENLPSSTLEPLHNKPSTEEQFQDFVAFSRQALHILNSTPGRPTLQ